MFGVREGSRGGGGKYDDGERCSHSTLRWREDRRRDMRLLLAPRRTHTATSLHRLKHRDISASESQQPQQLTPPELHGDVSDTLGSVADKTKAGDLRAACRLL